MLHNLKRSLSWYRPHTRTQDKAFDSAWQAFEAASAQTKALLAIFKDNDRLRGVIVDDLRSTATALGNVGEDWEIIKVRAMACCQRLRLLQQSSTDCDAESPQKLYGMAKEFLALYCNVLADINEIASLRKEQLKELDYYRGKVEYIKSQEPQKAAELEASIEAMEKATESYSHINSLVTDNIHRALDIKDQALLVCLSSFIRVQQEHATTILQATMPLNPGPDQRADPSTVSLAQDNRFITDQKEGLAVLQQVVHDKLVEFGCTKVDKNKMWEFVEETG